MYRRGLLFFACFLASSIMATPCGLSNVARLPVPEYRPEALPRIRLSNGRPDGSFASPPGVTAEVSETDGRVALTERFGNIFSSIPPAGFPGLSIMTGTSPVLPVPADGFCRFQLLMRLDPDVTPCMVLTMNCVRPGSATIV